MEEDRVNRGSMDQLLTIKSQGSEAGFVGVVEKVDAGLDTNDSDRRDAR